MIKKIKKKRKKNRNRAQNLRKHLNKVVYYLRQDHVFYLCPFICFVYFCTVASLSVGRSQKYV